MRRKEVTARGVVQTLRHLNGDIGKALNAADGPLTSQEIATHMVTAYDGTSRGAPSSLRRSGQRSDQLQARLEGTKDTVPRRGRRAPLCWALLRIASMVMATLMSPHTRDPHAGTSSRPVTQMPPGAKQSLQPREACARCPSPGPLELPRVLPKRIHRPE